MGLGVSRSLACFPPLVVLGQRVLLVGFELRLVGERVFDRPVLPLGIAFAFPALQFGQRPGFAVLTKADAVPGLARGIAGFGSHRMTP